MIGNPDDVSNQVIAKIERWLKHEVENTELTDEKLCENNDDFIVFGRRECAVNILIQIKKWKKEVGL